MFFCQAIFSDDAYKYILDDAPASAVGLIGGDAPIRKAVSNSLSASKDKSGLMLRCSSHETINSCYKKPIRYTTTATSAASPSSSPTTGAAGSPLNSPRSNTGAGGSPQSTTTATSPSGGGVTSGTKFEDYASASIKSLSSGVEGVLKVGWCKKHQVDVYSCVVLLVDWSKVGIAERVPFEEFLLKELERAKLHFGIPTRTNTKVVLALVTSAHSLSDAPPCGGYTTIEEAQKSIHSRLDISDRSLVVLYNNGKDSYSCQRLEGMVREHASKYHKEEVARLKRTKGSIPDRADAIIAAYEERRRPLPEHEEQSIHSKHDVEQILLAKKRFKIAWHSGVSGDQKTARRNLEKCLDALSGLPKPQTVEKWVLSTIVAWKMISHNLSIVDAGARDSSSRSPKIIEEVRKNVVSFLNHINWVVDLSVPANYIRNVLPNQDLSRVITPPQSSESTSNIQSMPDDEVLVNVMRMWYLSDFFELMAQRLERMRNLLPDDGSCAYLRGNVVLLPGFHHLCSARILQALRHYVFIREGISAKSSSATSTSTTTTTAVSTPTFLGAESYDASTYYKKLVFALPSATISGRVCEYINKCISWYSRYNLRRYVLFLMRDVAEHLMFVGDYEAAIVRINRLMLDTSIAQWPELAKGLHEMRIEATKAFLDQPEEDDVDGNENDHKHSNEDGGDNHSPNGSHRKRAFNVTSPASSGLSLAPMNARLKALQDLLQSRLFILLNSSPSARGLKENLLADANAYNLEEFAEKAFEEEKVLEAAGGGSMGVVTSHIIATSRDKARIPFPSLNVGNDPSLQITSHARVARMRMIGSDSSAVSAFPFLRVYAHFTKPYIESMKGRLLEEDAAASKTESQQQMLLDANASFVRGWEHGTNFGGSFPNNNASFSGASARPGILGPTTTSARSLGLTITFEASCSVPLRLYDIEVALARVLPTKEALAGRTRRARQALPDHSLRFCHNNGDAPSPSVSSGSSIPPYFVELSPKHPTWSTTVYALPSLGALEEGLVEITGLTANVLVATHMGNSVPASLSECDIRRGDSHTSSSATASLSANQTSPAPTKSKWALYSQQPPCQYSTFDAATAPNHKDVVSMPISYNISDALGDDYLSFFEEPLFDSKEQRMKQLVRVGGGTVSRHADLSSLSNVLTVVSHQYGSTLGVGQFATKLHRPVVRITKPVPRMRLTREVSTEAEKLAMEGDDHETGFILESTGDLPENGRLLIPYLSDIAEIVDVKCYNYIPHSTAGGGGGAGVAKKELLSSAAQVEDVTGSDSVRGATPVGYRIASISIDPATLVPSHPGAVVPQLYVCIRWRCFYAGLYHIPLRYEYETKKCADNVVPLLAQLHVVRPFQVCSTFSELSVCKTMGGDEKLLKTSHVPAPDDLDGSLRLPSPSPSRGRSIATEEGGSPSAALPATDFNPSDFMTISYIETNRLKGLGEFAAAQKQLTEAFSRVGGNSFAAPVNHEAAMRLIRADQHQHNLISSEGHSSVAGRQMRMANQLYSSDLSQFVEGGGRGGGGSDSQTPSNNNSNMMVAIDVGTISVAPDNFIMRRGKPFQVRLRLTNTAKYAVHIQRAVLDLRGGLEIVSSSVMAASGGKTNASTASSNAPSSGCYVLPNEEYTIVARIVGTSEINGSVPLGRALVWARKIASFPSRGLLPESTASNTNNMIDDDVDNVDGNANNSVNGTIVFPVVIPGVTISDFALHVVVSHPTTAIVGRPFNMAITVSNKSAVPSPRLRISLHGSIDRHFVPSGRIISTVPRIDSFGNAVMNISLVPVAPGNWLLPLVEVVTSDKEVVASSREVRSIAVHAAELAIDGK